jgi:N-methylhydantoinase A/oxoprolinase/acetone carboxylase beta subunit
VPGPACYGRGGTLPTVTDADLLLGRIPPDVVFPDLGRLDLEAARNACARAGVGPEGVVAVVDAAMEEAVRAVTVARGVDPRELALVAFGGAGPLHAVAIAEALGMKAVIVPPRAGVLSAVGLLTSPRRREVVRSYPAVADDPALDDIATSVSAEARALVGDGADVEVAYDCRYVGQSHELTVAAPADFPSEHERRNGHARPGAPVEVVAVRARATAAAPLAVTDLPAIARTKVRGPAVVAEPDCTIWVPDGWVAAPRELGAWVLERTA